MRKCEKDPKEDGEEEEEEGSGESPTRPDDQMEVVFDRRDFPFVLNDKDLCSLYIVVRRLLVAKVFQIIRHTRARISPTLLRNFPSTLRIILIWILTWL